MAAPDQILARVTTVLVQALGVDKDDVTPAASLLEDLGAESIDLLDIVFRLEREFAIAIPRGELFIEPASPGEAEYVRDGRVTAEGLAALRARMPYADLSGPGARPAAGRRHRPVHRRPARPLRRLEARRRSGHGEGCVGTGGI